MEERKLNKINRHSKGEYLMLYIVSQNGLRITDLHALSVVPPEHDRHDDGVYKVYVNGAEFARYSDAKYIHWIMDQVKTLLSHNQNGYFTLPAEDKIGFLGGS